MWAKIKYWFFLIVGIFGLIGIIILITLFQKNKAQAISNELDKLKKAKADLDAQKAKVDAHKKILDKQKGELDAKVNDSVNTVNNLTGKFK
jgi:uncharacterized membrane-anchored protein YhcB (DUF1043 family)